MCPRGGNAQCDSTMDRNLITKTLNDLTETIEALGPKVTTVQKFAKDIHCNMEEVNVCLDSLKLDTFHDFLSLEKLFIDVNEPPIPDLDRKTANKCEILIHENYKHLLHLGMGADSEQASNAALLRKVLEVLHDLIEFTNEGLDTTVKLIEMANKETASYLKDQKGVKEDVTKRFAKLKELVQAQTTTD